MPHFEWLGLADAGPSTTRVWARALLAIVLGWLLAGVLLVVVSLVR